MPHDQRTTAPLDLASLVGRAAFPAEVARASGMQRLDYVLELAEPLAFVQALAVEELYLLLKDIGEHDSHVLLEYASQEQLSGLIDIDVWHKQELLLSRWVHWLDMCLAVDLETGMRFIEATEDELIELLFVRELAFHPKDIDQDAVPDDLALIESPCGTYWVTYPHDHELAERIPHLLRLLWGTDMKRMLDIAHCSRFELSTSLEETLVHFRRGRIEDLGFLAPDEAMEVFRFVPPVERKARLLAEIETREPIAPWSMGALAGDLVLRAAAPPELLGEALAELPDPQRARFGSAFTHLVNQVYMARTGDLSRTDELPAAARLAAGLTNLGLAWLSDETLPTASRLLALAWPKEIFQVGHSLTFQLALRARRVRRRAGVEQGLALFGPPTDEAMLAVSQPQPMLFVGDDDPAPGWRPFETLADLRRVEALVAQADAVLAFFESHLGFGVAALLEAPLAGFSEGMRRRVRLEMLLATGLAQLLLTDELAYRPLTAVDLFAFHALAFEGGKPTARLAQATQAIAREAAEPVRAWLDRAFMELGDALARIRAHELAPAYAAELMLVAPAAPLPDDATERASARPRTRR